MINCRLGVCFVLCCNDCFADTEGTLQVQKPSKPLPKYDKTLETTVCASKLYRINIDTACCLGRDEWTDFRRYSTEVRWRRSPSARATASSDILPSLLESAAVLKRSRCGRKVRVLVEQSYAHLARNVDSHLELKDQQQSGEAHRPGEKIKPSGIKLISRLLRIVANALIISCFFKDAALRVPVANKI